MSGSLDLDYLDFFYFIDHRVFWGVKNFVPSFCDFHCS